jgi:DNA-binding response OmpR family regulator
METLRRIKAAYPATCVIMVTAIEDIESAHKALGLGASDYVTKPFTMQYLNSVLEVHLIADRISPELK